MFSIKLGLGLAFLHHPPKLSLHALSPWISYTYPQANATTHHTCPEFRATKTTAPWDATALTDFELEYAQSIIINVS